ncbi:hypothetical protein OG301_39230 (plasmid) [Streptomyces platensis]|uniref:hypothetical protein n=1 Tax=Streptomyces platensis TaxID=58346 RepID=UPI002ED4B9C9|nr:hypothetical protein OG301_39230 [Streptomyces platensis]
MPHSRAEMAEVAERRREMFRRRRAGESMESIAKSFGVSRSTLSKDFTRAYRSYLEEEKTEADVWRRFQTDRYEELLAAVWPEALGGDVRANEQASKLIDKLCRLNGWDVPVKAEVSGPDGGPIALASGSLEEMEQLFNIARQIHADDDTEEGDEDLDDEDADDDSH